MRYLPVLLLTIASFNVQADIFTYTAPVEREDGSELLQSEIAGYNVYVNGEPKNDINPLLPTATSFDLSIQSGDTVSITTLDTDGRESAPAIAVYKPNAPGNITITIQR